MSQYQFLADCYVNGNYFQAGSTAFTADIAGGLFPTGWVPSGAVTPLDSAAQAAFYAAGPQPPSLIVSRWQGVSVPNPTVYWQSVKQSGGWTLWTLVGVNQATFPPIYTA
jgi:hypothetical protein